MAAAAILNFGKMSITLDWIKISAPNFTGTVDASNFKFGTQLGFGTSLPKTTFWTKIGGGLGQGSSQEKFGTPYVFLQPLKPETSNLVQKLGLGLAYQKQRFGPKLAGVWAMGASKKVGTPTYFCNR